MGECVCTLWVLLVDFNIGMGVAKTNCLYIRYGSKYTIIRSKVIATTV